MKISQNVKKCSSLTQIVNLINLQGRCDFSPEQLAAEHALNDAPQPDHVDEENRIKGHLRWLAIAGAKFDWQKALCILDKHFTELIGLRTLDKHLG